MNRFALAPAARRDLIDITDFIALDSPAAADRVLNAVFEACRSLAERPGIGHVRRDLTMRDVRFWAVLGRYLVVYRERPDGVEIVRVFGPGRNVAALLR